MIAFFPTRVVCDPISINKNQIHFVGVWRNFLTRFLAERFLRYCTVTQPFGFSFFADSLEDRGGVPKHPRHDVSQLHCWSLTTIGDRLYSPIGNPYIPQTAVLWVDSLDDVATAPFGQSLRKY